MKLIKTLIAASFMGAVAVPAGATICLLTVNEVVHMEGQCIFEASTDGSFVSRSATGDVFAMIFIDKPGVATGYWNEYENRAHSPLGTMHRRGACWSSSTATLCAWAD